MKWLTVVPAYGRDYKSKKAVQEAWDRGEDFLIRDVDDSGYVNKDDEIPEGVILHARYKNLTMIHEVKR